MGTPQFLLLVLALPLILSSSSLSSPTLDTLRKGASLSVEKHDDDVLISQNRVFSAGFYSVGENAYCFAIWFTEPLKDGRSLTVVWMANRDRPVNRKHSRLSLHKSGNLVLTDAGKFPVWMTDTNSISNLHLQLSNTGNLVLRTIDGDRLWQSFESPTNTLLPHQQFTKNTELVSSRSKTNHSSGSYKLFFDYDNVLRLVFNGFDVSSIYWYSPWLRSWEANRSTYDNSRIAGLDSFGRFNSTDGLKFQSADFGVILQRRLTLDVDGNIRLYSLDKRNKVWEVQWQAFSQPCTIHGICGANSLCTYHHEFGRRCACLTGYKLKNDTDWAYGCEPDFKLNCDNSSEYDFFQIPHAEFYGYDTGFIQNSTLGMCKKECLNNCDCKGFQYKFDEDNGYYLCFTKKLLVNGYHSLGFKYFMYVKVPKSLLTSSPNPIQDFNLSCSPQEITQLDRTYEKKPENEPLKFLLWLAYALGVLEIICITIFLFKTRQASTTSAQGYLQVATGFKRFTYTELKKASHNFREEIGRGGSGVVYKGILSNSRVVAIKRLEEANKGEEEFLAELSTIGRLNHMNLIETYGYCAEEKHRLLVYEHMANGSLAQKLNSNELNWEKRYQIALGTAKGLAYLHEECLEWVLHCDVKPQNILLDSNFDAKLADFGLSKLLNRGGIGNSRFSTMRGTRGYMAPEWVFNLPITSKVDVYSYGIVVLEMITGRSPVGGGDDGGAEEERQLVSWVREKRAGGGAAAWVEEIVDPTMEGEYEIEVMEILVNVALQCVEEDKDVRPSMSWVVDTLLRHEKDE